MQISKKLGELSPFEQVVLETLQRVPRGAVTTYQALSEAVGRPHASRAVGNALNKNPCAPDVPCHRVVYSDGRLGGYAGGSRKKIKLLTAEGVVVRNGRVVDFEKISFSL